MEHLAPFRGRRHCVLLFALLWMLPNCTSTQPIRRSVAEKGGHLVLQHPEGDVPLAAVGEYFKTKGRGRECFLYWTDRRNGTRLIAIECATDGEVRSVHTLSRELAGIGTVIDDAMWLGERRLFVTLDVNPSMQVGIALDLRSGSEWFFVGHGFAWDATGTNIAYFRDAPHFGSPTEVPSEVWVGTTKVCEIPSRSGRGLSWDKRGERLTVSVECRGGTENISVCLRGLARCRDGMQGNPGTR